MAFTDMLGQYVDNRIQGASDRLSQGYGLLTGDENAWNQQLGLNETEEERKKRLRREAQARGEVLPDDVVETTQVKTYGDGSQTETVKREIPAPAVATTATEMAPQPVEQPQMPPAPQLSMAEQAHQDEMARMGQVPAAPAPQAPAPQPQMAAPAAPAAPVAPTPEPQMAAQPQMAAPAAPVAPVAPSVPQAGQQAPVVPAVPTPGPGVQVAGPAQMPPAPPAPVVEAAPVPVAQPAARPQWAVDLEDAGKDQDKLMGIAVNRAYPESVRKDARDRLKSAMADEDKARAATDIVNAAAQGDPKAQSQLLNSIKPAAVKRDEESGKVSEGSYIRAYLYARLGLTELARDEQEKIAGKTKFGQVIVDGQGYEVETDSRGRILTARDAEGNKVESPILNKIRAESASAKATQTHTGKMQDVTTGEVYYERTTPQGIQLVDNNGKVYRGSSANLRPFGIGSDIGTKNIIQLNELQNKLAFAGPTASAAEREKVIAESEAKYGPLPDAFKSAVRAGQPLPAGVATGTPIAGAQGMVTAPAAQPAAMPTTTPGTAMPAPAAQVTPGPAIPGAAPAVNIPAATTPAGRVAGTEVGVHAAKSKTEIAQNLEEKKNAVRMTMPATEQNATSILNTLNDVMTHPGFDKTIGNPDILNKPLQMIPQGDRRAFAQKYKQLGGQEFLAAYNQLRGGGSISEIEGAKAEQAIAALKDTGISSEEFKKNAWILQDVVKTGIDNQRRLIGQPPKYQGSPEQEQAKEWLRANPNDPRAAAVRKRLAGF